MTTFKQFLETFIPKASRKSKQLNQAQWILETTGSSDAAELKAELDTELKLLFSDQATYQNLLAWEKEEKDPIAQRQINILIRAFKQNLIPQKLLEEISQKEAALLQSYANFRPKLDGKELSENDIRAILKNEKDPAKRKKAWEASKEIGNILAPQILALVHLRNQTAKSLGYPDYFQMQLDLQEVDRTWLLNTLEDLAQASDAAYLNVVREIEKKQAENFGVSTQELGPWSWSDPFCQEDPLDAHEFDDLVTGIDIAQASQDFYKKMGFDVASILNRSDMFERPGKNQHAFCINIDRVSDVRTLNNVQSSIKWLETVLHELGHAVYELGFDQNLPWLLREPPHMITTEAMALLMGRHAYKEESLLQLIGKPHDAMKKVDESLRRRQLIFSRWVLVMTTFESELYRDPTQDLNKLWWQAVEKYQKISAPKNRERKNDWAAKFHIALAPVYYFSYLLGEMFASGIEEQEDLKWGPALQAKLFAPGNRMNWHDLVKHVTGKPLTGEAWLKQFAEDL